jgi:hypothetical protein
VTHKNSGNDRNEIEVLVKIPVPAIFRARDRKEFLRNFEPSFQGFSSNATTSSRSTDCSGKSSSHKPKSNRKDDKKDTAKDVICRGCHKKGHKEVDCRELAKWLIISGAVKKLKESTCKQVLDNYHRHYSSDPPSKQISKSCVDQLRAFCEYGDMTPSQVVKHYNWDGYIGSDVADEEDGFETAAEGEDESN